MTLAMKSMWETALENARITQGKTTPDKAAPSSKFKRSLLIAEHSPIRTVWINIAMNGIPYWVSVQLSRHKIGVEHFISSQRDDITGESRNEKPQGALVNHRMVANAQAIINISRKRLCGRAHETTRRVWSEVVTHLWMTEPEIASVCVPECIYRGFCPEKKSCGLVGTDRYQKSLKTYRAGYEKGSMEDMDHLAIHRTKIEEPVHE